MFAQDTSNDNPPLLHDLAGELLAYVRTAASQGTPVHKDSVSSRPSARPKAQWPAC